MDLKYWPQHQFRAQPFFLCKMSFQQNLFQERELRSLEIWKENFADAGWERKYCPARWEAAVKGGEICDELTKFPAVSTNQIQAFAAKTLKISGIEDCRKCD